MTIQMQSETAQSAANGNTEFISFAIGNDQYGVDIMAVREIKGWSGVTHLPRQPDYVRGVMNLRGVMVPIIDLRRRLGQGATEATPTHIVIIVAIGERLVGMSPARHDLTVAFKRHAFAGQTQRGNQPGAGERR